MISLGLFEALNITTTIAAVSTPHLDSVAYAIGEPAFPSYVPGWTKLFHQKFSMCARIEGKKLGINQVVWRITFIMFSYKRHGKRLHSFFRRH